MDPLDPRDPSDPSDQDDLPRLVHEQLRAIAEQRMAGERPALAVEHGVPLTG